MAFYHKPSRTLLVTDAVIFVPKQPPECISNESLLASAKNGLAVKLLSKGKEVPQEPVVDNKINRQKGLFLVKDSKNPNFTCNSMHLIRSNLLLQGGKEWFFKSCFLVHQIFWNRKLVSLKCHRS